MLPGYYPSNSGDSFYIWSFDVTIPRPKAFRNGMTPMFGTFPFSALNNDPATLTH